MDLETTGTGYLPALTHSAHGQNPNCGDDIEVYVRASEDNLLEVRFGAQACPTCTASAALMCANVKGLSAAQALRLGEALQEALAQSAGTPWSPLLAGLSQLEQLRLEPGRHDCILLPWTTLKKALL